MPSPRNSPPQIDKVLHRKTPKLVTQKSSSKLVKYHSRLSPKLKHKKSQLSKKRREKEEEEERMKKLGSDLKMVESPIYKTKEIHLFNTEFAKSPINLFQQNASNSSLQYPKKVLFKDRSQQESDRKGPQLQHSKSKEKSNH